jgi:hypothetical protein
MAFDPTAWTRAGAADTMPKVASGLLGMAQAGAAEKRRVVEDQAKEKEKADLEALRSAHKSAEEAWIQGDKGGFNQAVGEMARYNQEAADGTVKLYGTLDRSNFVGASYQLMAAFTVKDPEQQNEYINAAIGQMGANHPYSKLLMEARDMPEGAERNALLLEGLMEAKRLRAYPGTPAKPAKTAEQIEREIAAREEEIEVKKASQELQRSGQKQRHDEYIRDLEKVPGGLEKIFQANQDQLAKNQAQIGKITFITDGLTQAVAAGDTEAGMGMALKEWGKKTFGVEDEATMLRMMARDITVTAAIGNLPPGVASDKDIELVMATQPGPNMNKETLAKYFQGVKRVLVAENARRKEYEAYAMSQTPPTTGGFIDHWEKVGMDKVNDELARNGMPPVDTGDIVGAAGPATVGTGSSPASSTGAPLAAPQPTTGPAPGITPTPPDQPVAPPTMPTYRYNPETKQTERVQ